MVIIKNIVAKNNMVLNTRLESKILQAGKPMLVRFGSEKELENLLSTGSFTITNAPPPTEIKGPKVITAPRGPAPDPVVIKETPQESATPPVKVERESTTSTEAPSTSTSTKCKKCDENMVLTSDEARPGVDILYCPKCATEVIVGGTSTSSETSEETNTPPEKTPTSAEKPKRVYSKCPICQKRKSQAATYCKKCEGKQE